MSVSKDASFSQLRKLETELHLNETCKNHLRLEQLLHKEFFEIGRSGQRFNRDEIMTELKEGKPLPVIEAFDFSFQLLDKKLVLVSYTSAHRHSASVLTRHTLRTSLWEESGLGWQLRYHQGTAMDVS